MPLNLLRVLAGASLALSGFAHGAIAPPPASGALAASLQGNQLYAAKSSLTDISRGTLAISGECTPTAGETFTLTYEASGISTGPYFGTFTETGTVTVALTTHYSQPGSNSATGIVVSWDAEFEIDSDVGDVTGTKTLAPTAIAYGYCQHNDTGQKYWGARAPNLSYEATIRPATGGVFTDQGTATGDLDLSHGVDHYTEVLRQRFILSTGVVAVGATAVALTPSTAVNPVGTEHTVTATATTASGDPVEGADIDFTVVGATSEDPGGPVQQSCTTDEDGQCSITYEGPTFPGGDTITGCADNDEDGVHDAGEPCGVATKEWVLPASTPGKATGGGQIVHVDGAGTTFGFRFKSPGGVEEIRGECVVRDHTAAKDKVDCVNVLAYVQVANQATIYGNATVNGEDHGLFRLHVTDNGESGDSDTLEFETEYGYVRIGAVTNGNIQVHPVSGQ